MKRKGRWVYDVKLHKTVAGPFGRMEGRIARDTIAILAGDDGSTHHQFGGQLRPRFILTRSKRRRRKV